MTYRAIAKLLQNTPDRSASYPVLLNYINSLAFIHDDKVQKRLLEELIREYVVLEKKVDSLLKNTLPETVANEIKYGGRYAPRPFNCTILFSDIAGFTRLSESISGEALIEFLDLLFKEMDEIIVKHKGTKIKTIGDAYMAVFGAPVEYPDHAVMAVRAGLAFQRLVDSLTNRNEYGVHIRVGIHTGSVMAGVVGRERMQFDIFGDNVNIASRFESSGEPGRVNVSHETYVMARRNFDFEERGDIALKNKANMKAYFVVKEIV